MASATPGRIPVWAVPLSLAATDGIDVSFFSCGYLDVSVPRVRSNSPIHSASSNAVLPALRFRIQKSPDQCSFASFPELIAGCRVFRRLSMPRHPPYTLGKLDLLDRGSILYCRLSSLQFFNLSSVQCRPKACTTTEGLLRQQVLERCPLKTERPEHSQSMACATNHEPRI
jgi:hypothetical protein